MKKIILLLALSFLLTPHISAYNNVADSVADNVTDSVRDNVRDEYYFKGHGELNPSIPTPEEFFGFETGRWLVRYDKVVEYFGLLAAKSPRASLETFGYSWEGREQVALIITSPANHDHLEDIRREHLRLTDPNADPVGNSVANTVGDRDKIIVHLGYNVHGGEIAGTDASVLTAYYLVASEDADLVRRLDEAVVFVEPAQNPDGRERAANYINSFHSWPPVSDPLDREHTAGVTPHRGNHFWNDLNRDWLPLSQVESVNRVAYYHRWYPNVYLDFHEMGSGSTYYFEPSPRSSWSDHIVPEATYSVLNGILAKYFSAALDRIGSLYFTKQSFTNLSPIYGSTYPDYQGGVGTTLEVGSTAGIEIETDAGIRAFRKNLRDNFEISLAALSAATDEKEVFLRHQADFFRSAISQAERQAEKYVVFGSACDPNLNRLFVRHLLQHKIAVYELTAPLTYGGKTFEPGSAWIAPFRQAQYRILYSIFEENTELSHLTYYDVSSWSTAHGYGIPFAKVRTAVTVGRPVTTEPEVKGYVDGLSDYAYVFGFNDYLSPKAVYYLQDHGVKVRVAGKEFTIPTASGVKAFAAGSIVVPVHYQTLASSDLHRLIEEAASISGISISSVKSGFSTDGIDLGSNDIKTLARPVVAAISGGGANWTSIGELWSLLGNTHNIPLSKVDIEAARRADLSRYTAIILTGGAYPDGFAGRLTTWVDNGGTLIATGPAAQWVVRSGLAPGLAADSAGGNGGGALRDRRINGALLSGRLNLAHPLTYGFTSADFYTIKTSLTGLPAASADDIVLETGDRVVDGYIEPELRERLKSLPVIVATGRGQGGVVLFGESPAFRGYFLAPGRILTNAVIFGVAGGGRRGAL
ncbi:MAG: hypothetical protein LBI58_01180 [Tannerellaceae bacterium]|jgi:hypothetical protein|nr:hypothetical protein [Tannerellaceae bacterium]